MPPFNRAAMLSGSVSAQDLRSLHVDKEWKRAYCCEDDEESPRGVLDECLRSFHTETTSTATAAPVPTPPKGKAKANTSIVVSSPLTTIDLVRRASTMYRPESSLWKGFLRMWRPMRRLSSLPALGMARLAWRRSNKDSDVDGSVKPAWRNFTLPELKKATNNFSQDNVIGKGGSAMVYKGSLDHDRLVAIKRLTEGEEDERVDSLLTEMGIMLHLSHPNIARLVGVGVEGGEHLVFELSPLGSLSNLLHGNGNANTSNNHHNNRGGRNSKNSSQLTWEARYRVAVGTARGLEYLHDKCSRRIIHRDIKAANILLMKDFEPQISDFGLAKWLPGKMPHHKVTDFEGTFGYLAPEYCTHGIVNEKTDIFAYGVLLLELITGRKALDGMKQSLVMWAKPLLDRSQIPELVDPWLRGSYNKEEVNRVAHTAHMCIQHSQALRPNISQILRLLTGEAGKSGSGGVPKNVLRRTYSEEIYDVDEYNATRYLNVKRPPPPQRQHSMES